mgnify:CR=1 FL=1
MRGKTSAAYLVQIDDRLPLVVALQVEMPHAHLSKVTGVEFVQVGAVMVLTTRHTAATRVLSVLSYPTVAGGNMAAATKSATARQ